MAGLVVPKLKGSVGGAKAKNDPDDVKVVQDLLNAAVKFGELPGFLWLAVDGKVTENMLKMIHSYQTRKGLGPSKDFKKAIIEPGKNTLKHLARNPYVDKRWSSWDEAIKKQVDLYNKKFGKTASYQELDWRIVKAQVWIEVMAGPDDKNWDEWPLQIGRFKADKGMQVIRDGRDHSELITDKELREKLRTDARSEMNIKAGVAYLVHCAARYEHATIIGDPAEKTYELKPGQSLAQIAPELKTTVEILMSMNKLTEESVKKLRPGAKLKYQLAHKVWRIASWISWEDAVDAYNGGGDPDYMTKHAKALERIKKKW